nr:MAG TPA: hypothetical protein [Caudoviricetes sp.]
MALYDVLVFIPFLLILRRIEDWISKMSSKMKMKS